MSILGGAAMPPLVGWSVRRLTDQGLQGSVVYSRGLGPSLIAAALSLTPVTALYIGEHFLLSTEGIHGHVLNIHNILPSFRIWLSKETTMPA